MKKYGGKRWFYAKGCRDRDAGRVHDFLISPSRYQTGWPYWAYCAYWAGYHGIAP